MILERRETNNGYRCSCCAGGEEYAEWIEVYDKLSFMELLDKAYDYNDNIDGTIVLQYEDDGNVLYGYETQFGKTYTEVFIRIGEKVYIIVSKGKNRPVVSREEIMEIWKEQAR